MHSSAPGSGRRLNELSRKIAFVSGASRGIGRASALALAEAGWDVVLAARRMQESERYDDRGAQTGSLLAVAAEIAALGRRALPVRIDLRDRKTIEDAAERVLREWGPVDLLVNNAVYVAASSNARLLDIPAVDLEETLSANVVSPLRLVQCLLPAMIERGRGIIINLISGGALVDPPAPAGSGGWSFPYAAEKSALHRLTGMLAVEHGRDGILAYSLQPGAVRTETLEKTFGPENVREFARRYGFVPIEVPAATVVWLAESSDAREHAGGVVFAEKVCRNFPLVPGWPKRDD